jgi:glycosyltransferase involved in cell wall biosynthesis
MATGEQRPGVSVIVPFLGEAEEAAALLQALAALELRHGDEILLADNGSGLELDPPPTVRIVDAAELRSSYHARNVAAGQARNPWLLFMDADCRPPATLLDDYFREPVPEGCEILAGEISGDAAQTGIAARHATFKEHLSPAEYEGLGIAPVAATANLMVARALWERLGGFREVRSGADFEFCVRAAEAGAGLAHRPGARLVHRHPDRLRESYAKARRYGAGQAWLNRLHPGAGVRPELARRLAGAVGGVLIFGLTARFERARFKAIDGVWHTAYAWGYWRGSNDPPPAALPGPAG